jgi:hypothetical protein
MLFEQVRLEEAIDELLQHKTASLTIISSDPYNNNNEDYEMGEPLTNALT